MKPKKVWANVAVKDIQRTTDFYTSLGLKPNMPHSTAELTSFLFGEDEFVIHFFKEGLQPGMDGIVADAKSGHEIMFTLSAESEEEVNNWTKAVTKAGGTVIKEAGRDKSGYYFCVFADPDGHKFNVLLMEKGM